MIIIIIISTIQLAADNPLSDPDSNYLLTLLVIDKFLTIIFSIECLMKIVAFGLINCGSTSYFKSIWNFLDLIIVLVSVSKEI
jgi:hypothetical protein